MDIAVNISMGVLLFLALFIAVYQPFKLGKPKQGNYTATEYIIALVQIAMTVVIAGRIFNWW